MTQDPNAISPAIQLEINKQINIGLKQFFTNLDKKLEEQSHFTHQSFERTPPNMRSQLSMQ
jgi:hypothetical protein